MGTWIILIICAYILGSIPVSLLAAKTRGVDLRKHGTLQVGAGNVWRLTSRRLGLAIGIFDFCKGAVMILIAAKLGLTPAEQLVVGIATVVGHNWPVFLRFHGGRGVATSGGVILVMPLINDMEFWGVIAYFIILIGAMVLYHSSPVAVLVGVAIQPVFTAAFGEPLALTLAYVALLLLIIIKRLTAQPAKSARRIGMGRLLLNRLLFDRDISDRKAWVTGKHEVKKEPV